MFLINPYAEELPNMAQHPIIYKQKLIEVGVNNSQLGVDYFFPKDEEIDNSIVKGIKWEMRAIPPIGAVWSGTTSITTSGITYATVSIARFMKVSFVNAKDEQIIQDQPLYSFAGVRVASTFNLTVGADCKVTPRTNIRICLRKCFINITGAAAAGTNFRVLFSIDYLPLK